MLKFLVIICSYTKEYENPMETAFIDFEEAFDSINPIVRGEVLIN